MSEKMHRSVLESLDRLSTIDPVAALDAQPALSWLVGPHGLDRLHQAGLQQFLWYDLPFKWLGPLEGRRALVAALGRFFDMAGMSRYAELCRSETTSELLDLWATDAVAGFDSFHRTHVASGIVPPDVDHLGWGDLMGADELAAFWSTAQALELAVEAGVLKPGRRGWRKAQVELAREHLDQPRPERLGESLRDAVLGERLAGWVEEGRSEARASLVADVTKLLLHDTAPPPGTSRAVRPLTWIIVNTEKPVRAASPGGFPPRLVREAAEHFGWGPVSSRAPESGLPALVAARELATAMGLVRRSAGRWGATPAGSAALGDSSGLWRTAARLIGRQEGFGGAVSELLDAVLLSGDRPQRRELIATIRVPLTEEGWHGGHTGRPVASEVLAPELDRQIAARVALGAIARRGGHAAPPYRLTGGGHALARAALRARALRPRARDSAR